MALPALLGAIAPYAAPLIGTGLGALGSYLWGGSSTPGQSSSLMGKLAGPALGAGVGALAGRYLGGASPLEDVKNLASGAKNTLLGTQGQFQQQSVYTPEQLEFIKTQIMPLLIQQLQQPFGSFAPIASEARRQFAEEGIPSLAERFTSLGRGAISSPSFQSRLGGARAGLESQLAALQSRYDLAQQGLGQQRLNTLLGVALAPQFQSAYMPGQPGILQSAAPGLSQLGSIKALQSLGLL